MFRWNELSVAPTGHFGTVYNQDTGKFYKTWEAGRLALVDIGMLFALPGSSVHLGMVVEIDDILVLTVAWCETLPVEVYVVPYNGKRSYLWLVWYQFLAKLQNIEKRTLYTLYVWGLVSCGICESPQWRNVFVVKWVRWLCAHL